MGVPALYYMGPGCIFSTRNDVNFELPRIAVVGGQSAGNHVMDPKDVPKSMKSGPRYLAPPHLRGKATKESLLKNTAKPSKQEERSKIGKSTISAPYLSKETYRNQKHIVISLSLMKGSSSFLQSKRETSQRKQLNKLKHCLHFEAVPSRTNTSPPSTKAAVEKLKVDKAATQSDTPAPSVRPKKTKTQSERKKMEIRPG
ncbi:unnamed protein product [Cylicocyclus nassatus]|uniref:Uncharacterized protein n=1 Tax=Cylicocyclus nassatus TaxID=53992 RepID=A0AA36MAA8_CYLNA|nr:unnamed protein product [Cylicocyclus nassatus]